MNTTSRDILRLVPDKVELQVLDGNVTRRSVSHFLDLVVNGQSLIGLVLGEGNYVTELNRAWLPSVPTTVAVLLGRHQQPDLEAGRVPLLVCSVDGDLGCGALTAALTVAAETMSWSDFRWQDGLRDPDTVEGVPEAMTFDRRQYEHQLEQAVARVSELPYDEAEHKSRRFLWPWQWGWRLPRDD